MPTVFAHALVPIALAAGLGSRTIPPRLACAGIVAAMLPDADVIGFALDIPYADALGHRGASHSIVAAAVAGLCAAALHRGLRAPPMHCFAFVAFAMLSHPLLDMLTTGGLGVALAWPWSDQRMFAPWRVIEVSPIGRGFFIARGLEVLRSEAAWIGVPCALLAIALRLLNRRPARAG